MKIKTYTLLALLFVNSVNVIAATSSSSSSSFSKGFRSSNTTSKSSISSINSSKFTTNKSTNTTSKLNDSKNNSQNTKSSSFTTNNNTTKSSFKGNTSITEYFNKFKANSTNNTSRDNIAQSFNKTRKIRRSEYLKSYRPPTYVAAYPQNFGMWDSLMLWSILDNINDRAMYYNHKDDPGMKEWYAAAQEQAKTNAELRDKLSKLDEYVKYMEQNKISPNSSYLPTDNPDLWINSSTELTKITVCTSSNVDGYATFVKDISKYTQLSSEAIKTNGTLDNIEKLTKSECDLGIIQADAITTGLVKIKELGLEPAILVCSNKHSDEKIVYVAENETGSQHTLNKVKDSINATNVMISHTASDAVMNANENNSCMFTVSNPSSASLKFADALKMKLIPISTHENYIDVIIDDTRYKNMKSVDTIATKTLLVTTNNWIANHKEVYDKILTGLTGLTK